VGLAVPVPVTGGGTGASTAAGARGNLGAAAAGANADITALAGLAVPIPVTGGGTGASDAPGARTSLGAAAAGVNSDITALTGLTAPLPLIAGTAAAPALSVGTPTTGLYAAAADTLDIATLGVGRLQVRADGTIALGLPGNLDLPASTALTGNILKGGVRFIHDEGTSNTALGRDALASVTGGISNTAVGNQALQNATTSSNSTAVGVRALQNALTGQINTALGLQALDNVTSGFANVAIGHFAGTTLTTGNDNIYIRSDAGATNESNTTRIGGVNQTRAFIAGIAGATVVNSVTNVLIDQTTGQLGALTSSRRFKEDIQDMGEGSARLLQLRPVTFRYRTPAADGTKPLQYGLIAEEVAEVSPDLVAYDGAGRPLSVAYHLLPALLLNEAQRQHRRIEAQEAALRAQAAELAELRARLERLERGPAAAR
jgi:hypothetical protein